MRQIKCTTAGAVTPIIAERRAGSAVQCASGVVAGHWLYSRVTKGNRTNLKCIMVDYESAVIAVRDMSADLVARMADLYLDNYDGTSVEIFRNDLACKDEAVVLIVQGRLVGFTTLQVYVSRTAGKPVRIVYSGDTIVDRRHWGQQQLAFAWIRRIGEIKAQAPDLPLYWLLLVKGHRTFKYLSVFSRSFHPHWQLERPDLKPLADRLARERFGADYNSQTGVVEFSKSRGHLKPDIASPTGRELARPDTRFFVESNPGFRRGHELVCICELEPANMKPLAARIFGRSQRSLLAV